MGDAVGYCLRPEHLRRTLTIAVVVGTVLTAVNLGDVILSGDAAATTWVKAAANYLVPFVVSNLGLLAGRSVNRSVPESHRSPSEASSTKSKES